MLDSRLVVLFVVSFVIVLCVSTYLNNFDNSCVVVVSGHSIVIRGCEFSPEFIDYAKTLQIPKL
nr:putative TGB3 protein [Red clover carlavirus 1]